MSHCRTVSLAIALVAVVGCGSPPDAPRDPMDDGRFSEPADFDRTDCGGEVAVGAVDAAGIWHLDLDFGPDGRFPGVLRLDGDADGLTGLLFGRPLSSARQTDSDLLVRVFWVDGDGVRRLRAIDFCAGSSDGALRGQYVSCRDDDCLTAAAFMLEVKPLDEPVAAGVELVGEIGAAWTDSVALNVRQADGIAYVARGYDGLRVVDVGDPAAPVEVGHVPVAVADVEFYNDVKILPATSEKTYVMAASNVRGAVIVDVTDPAAPAEVTSVPPPPAGESRVNVHSIFVTGGRAYLANYTTGGLDIYDVADPAAPVAVGGYLHPPALQFGGFVHDLYVDGEVVYLNYWNLGMVIVDTAGDPADPTEVGVFDSYPRRTSHSSWVTGAGDRQVALHGDEDFGAHVQIVDVDPGSVDFLNVVGSYQTRPEVSVHNVMAAGELGLITYYQDGLRLLDLANPADPQEIGHYRSWDLEHPVAADYGASFFEGAIGVDYDPGNGLIFLADTHRGLLILRQAQNL